MKALKFSVIAMGVVLAVGFVALFASWRERTADTTAKISSASPGTPGIARVELPTGSQVIQLSSASRHLDVLVENADHTRDIYRVHAASGNVLSVIQLRPVPHGQSTQPPIHHPSNQ